MPVTVRELFTRRSQRHRGDTPTFAELLYVIQGTSEETDALTAVKAAAPATYLGLPRLDIDLEYIAPYTWNAQTSYKYSSSRSTSSNVGDVFESFEITTESRHISHSLDTVRAYKRGAGRIPGSPHDRAINVQTGPSGTTIGGTEILVPVETFTLTATLAPSFVDDDFRDKLRASVAHTNARTFRGYRRGECLFIGASGAERADGNWDLAFRFAVSPNADITVDGIPAKVEKGGWEYMWIETAEAKTDVDGVPQITRQTVGAYVERQYNAAEFDDLNIE